MTLYYRRRRRKNVGTLLLWLAINLLLGNKVGLRWRLWRR